MIDHGCTIHGCAYDLSSDCACLFDAQEPSYRRKYQWSTMNCSDIGVCYVDDLESFLYILNSQTAGLCLCGDPPLMSSLTTTNDPQVAPLTAPFTLELTIFSLYPRV